jgi:ATP-dependent helicase/nuclease subunit A
MIAKDPASAANAAQRPAVDPASGAWVMASAGSGKTRVLIDRLLALLLRPDARPERILCITYTRAAAAEIRNRLAAQLAAWAVVPEVDLARRISALTAADPVAVPPPEPETIARARSLFARTLDTPGGLAIDTIHGFCTRVIQRFPIEAGVAPGVAVLDEPAQSELLRTARDKVLARALAGDPFIDRAFAVIGDRLNADEVDRLLQDILRRREQIQAVAPYDGDGDPLATAERISRAVMDALGLVDEPSVAVVEQEAAAWVARHRDALEGLAHALHVRGGKEASGSAARIDAYFRGDGDLAELSLAVLTVENRIPKKPRFGRIDPFALVFAQRMERFHEDRVRAHAFERSVAALRIGWAVSRVYEEAKAAAFAVDYDDLIQITRALLAGDGAAAWAMFKLDEGIDHILLDEAQDTSPAQWDIVAELTREMLAGVAERHRTLFVVGDKKQSIYSFQGARPERFETLRNAFLSRATEVAWPLASVDLDWSYRSTDAVLRVVDAVFTPPAMRVGMVAADETLRHRAVRQGQGGLVELWPSVTVDKDHADESWAPPTARREALDATETLADLVARRLARMIADGERLDSLDRPMRAGDILILLRKRGRLMAALVRRLTQVGLAVAGTDRMALTTHLAVRDMLAFGRFLVQPGDDLALATVLVGPLGGLDHDQLLAVANPRPGSLWAALRDHAAREPTLAPVTDWLRQWLAVVDRAPPHELFARMLAEGGRARLRAAFGAECDEPLDEFLSACLDREADGPPSLQRMLDWFARTTREIKRDQAEATRDEVRVMTVHGAKGLEAPVVVLADGFANPLATTRMLVDTPVDGRGELPLFAKSKEDLVPVTETACQAADEADRREHRRLLYVALTRARDRLYVTGVEPTKKVEGFWYDAVAAGMDRLAETVSVDVLLDGGAKWGPVRRFALPQTTAPEADRPVLGAAAMVAVLPDWARTAVAPEVGAPRAIRPSESQAPGSRSPVADPAAMRRGRLVHRLLQSLPDLAAADRAPAARRFLAHPAHGLGVAAVEELLGEVMAVIAEPAFAAVFADGSRAEVPIVGTVGGRAVIGRIDRLAVTDRAVLIVDFKTNRPPPRDLDQVDPAHLDQLALYRALVTQLYPDRPVEAALLWTDLPALMPVPGSRLDQALDRIGATTPP